MVNSIFIINRHGGMDEELAQTGEPLMQVLNQTGRVEAVCGGSMACGTCAVRVQPPWRDRLKAPSDTERDLLEGLGIDEAGCRLSCQILIDPSLNGVVLEILQRS